MKTANGKTKRVKADIVPGYRWKCPGCHELNFDDTLELENIHRKCKCDYIHVKCGNCNGGYIIEGSDGWLAREMKTHGASTIIEKWPKWKQDLVKQKSPETPFTNWVIDKVLEVG